MTARPRLKHGVCTYVHFSQVSRSELAVDRRTRFHFLSVIPVAGIEKVSKTQFLYCIHDASDQNVHEVLRHAEMVVRKP